MSLSVRRIVPLVVCAGALAFSGCGLVATHQYSVEVTSVPSDASVTVTDRNNRVIHQAVTPTNIVFEVNNMSEWPQYTFVFEKEGYGSFSTVLIADSNPDMRLNGFSLGLDTAPGWKFAKSVTGKLMPLGLDGSEQTPAPAVVAAPLPAPVASVAAPVATAAENPLRIRKWEYDQETQKAVFEFNVVSDDADVFALRLWALQQIRQICNEEYAQANSGSGKSLLGFSLVSKLDMPKFVVDATVFRIRPMSHTYDAVTRTGSLKVNVGQRGDSNYAGAYKWALDNIGEICSSKAIAMEAGQPPPPGARYEILSEKTTDDGMLEIAFKVLQ